MEKPYLRCSKCNEPFHFPARKWWGIKYLLFFLPVKAYFCAKCKKRRHIWLTDEEAKKYHRVRY